MFMTNTGDLAVFGDILGQLGVIVFSRVFLGKVYSLLEYSY